MIDNNIPPNYPATVNQTTPVISNQPVAPTPTTPQDLEEELLNEKNLLRAKRIVALGLTIQGLWGIYLSMRFILVDLPGLEEALAMHRLSNLEVNTIASQAILIIISTIVSMYFALLLTVVRNKAVKIANIVIGVIIFLLTTYLQNFFNGLPLIEIWGNLINTVLDLKNN